MHVNRFAEKVRSGGLKLLIGVRKAFRDEDKGGDGTIPFASFRTAIYSQGIEMSEMEIKNLFKAFDKENSGYLDYL